jgi:hypothetical protein
LLNAPPAPMVAAFSKASAAIAVTRARLRAAPGRPG